MAVASRSDSPRPPPREAGQSSLLNDVVAEMPKGSTSGDERVAEVEAGSLALALMGPSGESRPLPSDSRELVPVTPVQPSRVEQLLAQVLEENRALRMRLDQVETQSSWHSGGTRMSNMEQSPVSFEPGGCEPTGMGVGSRLALEGLPTDASGQIITARAMAPTGQMGLAGPSRPQWALPVAPPPPVLGQGVQPPLGLGNAACGYEARLREVGVMDLSVGHRSGGDQGLVQRLERQVVEGFGGVVSDVGPGVPSWRPRTVEGPVNRITPEGYPVTPRGTVIRPPPGPPPETERADNRSPPVMLAPQGQERPEEPAKYIFELPKLPNPEVSTSAVVCGNWLAQVRQILVGLSPSAGVWWSSVEQTASSAYQRWLTADPVDRRTQGLW